MWRRFRMPGHCTGTVHTSVSDPDFIPIQLFLWIRIRIGIHKQKYPAEIEKGEEILGSEGWRAGFFCRMEVLHGE